jgi:hypothetical protein
MANHKSLSMRSRVIMTTTRGEHCLLKLFGSAEDILDSLLLQWSDRVELLGSGTVGRLMEPRARQITDGNARYDHASDFLHDAPERLRTKSAVIKAAALWSRQPSDAQIFCAALSALAINLDFVRELLPLSQAR